MTPLPLPKRFFDILACPICKQGVLFNSKKNVVMCTSCHKTYPIKEGIIDFSV